ncbi:Pentatricopeptide repeat-containing protein At4g30825, chloroplastic [Linum perenne]
MQLDGFSVSLEAFNCLLDGYGKEELKECGLRPDICSYNTLIKAYGIAGMVKEAVSLMKEMRENGVEPNKITYTNLIIALQKNDEYLESVKWSLWMKQLGL